MNIKELNEALEKFLEDVHFKNDNITLNKEEIIQMQSNIHDGNLTGEIKGHKYELKVYFSSGKNFEDLTPNMKRYVFDVIYPNVDSYRSSETITIISGQQGGFTDSYGFYTTEYILSKEDLESISNNIKHEDDEYYTTIDISTRLIWDGNRNDKH